MLCLVECKGGGDQRVALPQGSAKHEINVSNTYIWRVYVSNETYYVINDVFT